jgi:hypothetical protein
MAAVAPMVSEISACGAVVKINLPDVTLVAIETREHALMRLAIEDCLSAADFGDVLVLTDAPHKLGYLGDNCRVHIVPDWDTKLGWVRGWWYEPTPLLRTAYTLNVEWDGGIWDTSMWTDEFMRYDYIGAPWWWHKEGKKVGNGGFSLMSTRLRRYLRDRQWEFPCDSQLGDDLLCRKYRPKLEERGFTWAPEQLAHDFSLECCRSSPETRHFGYHAMFNWPKVLPYERVRERVELAMLSPYIRGGYKTKAFIEEHPDIAKRLIEEDIALSLQQG